MVSIPTIVMVVEIIVQEVVSMLQGMLHLKMKTIIQRTVTMSPQVMKMMLLPLPPRVVHLSAIVVVVQEVVGISQGILQLKMKILVLLKVMLQILSFKEVVEKLAVLAIVVVVQEVVGMSQGILQL